MQVFHSAAYDAKNGGEGGWKLQRGMMHESCLTLVIESNEELFVQSGVDRSP